MIIVRLSGTLVVIIRKGEQLASLPCDNYNYTCFIVFPFCWEHVHNNVRNWPVGKNSLLAFLFFQKWKSAYFITKNEPLRTKMLFGVYILLWSLATIFPNHTQYYKSTLSCPPCTRMRYFRAIWEECAIVLQSKFFLSEVRTLENSRDTIIDFYIVHYICKSTLEKVEKSDSCYSVKSE